jgi:hypothetical protein
MINNSFDYIESKQTKQGFLILYQDKNFKKKENVYLNIKIDKIIIVYEDKERIFYNVDRKIIKRIIKRKSIDIMEVEVDYKDGVLMTNGNVIDSYKAIIKK